MVGEEVTPYPGSKDRIIMEFLMKHKMIIRKKVQELLGISQSTAERILKTMLANGFIAQLGGSGTARYEPVKR